MTHCFRLSAITAAVTRSSFIRLPTLCARSSERSRSLREIHMLSREIASLSPGGQEISPEKAPSSPSHPQSSPTTAHAVRVEMTDTCCMTGATSSGFTVADDTLGVGLATENWTGDALFHEYSAAVDPLAVGAISPVPLRRFPASLHASGPTRTITLDLSDGLGVTVPATGP